MQLSHVFCTNTYLFGTPKTNDPRTTPSEYHNFSFLRSDPKQNSPFGVSNPQVNLRRFGTGQKTDSDFVCGIPYVPSDHSRRAPTDLNIQSLEKDLMQKRCEVELARRTLEETQRELEETEKTMRFYANVKDSVDFWKNVELSVFNDPEVVMACDKYNFTTKKVNEINKAVQKTKKGIELACYTSLSNQATDAFRIIEDELKDILKGEVMYFGRRMEEIQQKKQKSL